MLDPDHPAGAERESGIALVMAMFLAIVVTGIVLSGTLVLRSHRQQTETSFRLHGQASQFARAGLTEGLSWFRKQTSQPVVAFAPEFDPTAKPPVLDTADPDIGLMREFEISGSTWGRYEVWKRWDADPDPVRLAWRKQMQAEDISAQRSASGAGTVWRIRSVGYVFRRLDPTKNYDESPNGVLATDIAEVELRRMTLAPPGQAAVCTAMPGASSVNAKARVQGMTGAGIYFPNGMGTPSVAPGSVTGFPALSGVDEYAGSVDEVFGVSAGDLRSISDDVITKESAFPAPIPPNSMLFVEVPLLRFTPVRRLLGNGIVYVKGDVVLEPGSNSFFTGLLYVDGSLTVQAPAELNGSFVVTKGITVAGVSDFANVGYDDAALQSLRTEIGQYRLSGAIRSVIAAE
jgi:hypothetical protein